MSSGHSFWKCKLFIDATKRTANLETIIAQQAQRWSTTAIEKLRNEDRLADRAVASRPLAGAESGLNGFLTATSAVSLLQTLTLANLDCLVCSRDRRGCHTLLDLSCHCVEGLLNIRRVLG